MPLEIIRDDITRVKVDAIVNAANESLLGGGGVDGAIHSAAGKELLEECKALGGCKTGDAKITKGYNLSAKYIIHTVGPIWNNGLSHEKELLISCYKKSLALAEQYKCKSIAFPLISSGIYGYPKDQALKIAIDTIGDYLLNNDIKVYIVVFDKNAFQISTKLFEDIQEYIDNSYVDEYEARDIRRFRTMRRTRICYNGEAPIIFSHTTNSGVPKEIIGELDESFTEMLLRKIDEKGMTDTQCYKRANIDRKLFSKIRSDLHYHPSKQTAFALVIALELDINESTEMLKKAGFAISHSNKSDIIVEYFIKNSKYDINEINEVLFTFDQKTLGY